MSEPNLANRDRHCAYCLKFLPSGSAKICGKCRRRAYCSKECQVADWKQGKGSQGHKNWCDLKCGEEDIDWEIRPMPGKGLGVIAKRPIPSKFRIMIDAIRSTDHPAIQDLMPIGGTLQEKVTLNTFGCDGNAFAGEGDLHLRVARINHDCNPNAEQCGDHGFEIMAIIAKRDIQPDEEITIPYLNGASFRDFLSAKAKRLGLEKTWGIICKPECFCRDKDFEKMLLECADLDRDIDKFLSTRNVIGAMQAARKLIGNFDAVHAPWSQRTRILSAAFCMGIMKKATLKEAKEYLRRAIEITDEIGNPKSPEIQLFKSFMAKPSLHKNYLILEKK